MSKPRLFLIDGNSLVYRAYYAIRRLSNSRGFATNAIYGFFTSLRKLIEQESPDYVGVVFDSKGPTVRHDLYQDYKATRKPMPEDLVPQVPKVKDLLQALRIPFFEQPGYEGDDLLGSLARRAARQHVHTVIVSHDKDLFQLVDRSTSIYHPIQSRYLDVAGVEESFGVRPHQVVDVLALWGDASDNIPGVPGVGEKTAKDLITRYGSLDNLLDQLDSLANPRLRTKIQDNRDALELSRKLATIHRDIQLDFDLKNFEPSEPDYDRLIPLLQDLEFTSLLSDYIGRSRQEATVYTTILEETALGDLVAAIRRAGAVALDTETDSPFPTRARLVGMSFALEPGKATYLPLGHDYSGAPAQIPKDRAFKHLSAVLTDPGITKIGQNIKYDYIVLHRAGITVSGAHHDTMVLSYLLEPNWGKHNLARLALTYLQTKAVDYHEIVGKGKDEITMNAVEIPKVTPYACQDADLALQLSKVLLPKVRETGQGRLYQEIEQPLIEVLAHMEMWGIKIDPAVLANLSTELKEEMETLKEKIYAHSGEAFNINSPQQLSRILFEKLKLPSSLKTKKTRGLSTSMEVLQHLAKDYPIAEYTLEYRQLAKLKSTYADALPRLIHSDTGRIHTSYNQTVAATGRLSSSDPNLQNIPVRGRWGPRFRQAFVPEPGHLFLSADYSQIELRVLAHMSEDAALIDTFVHDRDIHQETANQVFGESGVLFNDDPRRRAKIINFSMIYGSSAFSLARELGTSTKEAQGFIDRYFQRFPKVHEFLESSVEQARKHGYSETLFGRRRQVPELHSPGRATQQAGRRIALNTPIQGTAADLMKKAMIDIWQAMTEKQMKARMILQVHDELVFEVPQDEYVKMEKLVQTKMERVLPLKVPLKVHLAWGINWAEAK
jgi:DNA polymerase-1